MAFHSRHQNNNQNRSFRGNQQRGSFQPKPPTPVPPPRVYRDDELHIDVVDLSFNDIRRVETGKYADETPVIEYLSEAQANERGFGDQWRQAQPIEEYRKSDKD